VGPQATTGNSIRLWNHYSSWFQRCSHVPVPAKNQLPHLSLLPGNALDSGRQKCLMKRQARYLAPNALLRYQHSLGSLQRSLRSEGVIAAKDVTASALCRFFLHLRNRGTTPAAYTTSTMRWMPTSTDTRSRVPPVGGGTLCAESRCPARELLLEPMDPQDSRNTWSGV